MKSLLIDNYDSYSYNLFQLVAKVSGEEPIVIKNDELTYEKIKFISGKAKFTPASAVDPTNLLINTPSIIV